MVVVVPLNAAVDVEVHAQGTLILQAALIAVVDVVHRALITPRLHPALIVHQIALQDVPKLVLMHVRHKHHSHVQIVHQTAALDVVEVVTPTVVATVVCNVHTHVEEVAVEIV